MKNKLLILFSFLNVVLHAQTIIFQKTYGSTAAAEDDFGQSVQQTSDGGYVIAGYSDSFGNGTDDFYLVKTNAMGDTLWTKVYGTIDENQAYEVQETFDGGYIVVGTSGNASTQNNVVLFKTYSNGGLQWYKTYIGTNAEEGHSVMQTNDGGYILLGSIFIASPYNYQMYLMKTNSNGDTLWTKKYGTYTQGASVQQTSDGGYILAGNITDTTPLQEDVHLIKTDSNGDTLWTKTYGGTKHDEGKSVKQTNDGGYIITGYTKSMDTTIQYGQVYLIKTNSNGDTVWAKKINNSNCLGALGNSVKQTADGGYIIGGTHGYVGQEYDMYLVKTNSNGDTLWTRMYGGTNFEGGNSVQQTTDKGYIVVGFSQSNGFFYDVYLVKTDSIGNTSPLVSVAEQQFNKQAEINIVPNPFFCEAEMRLPESINLSKQSELRIYDLYGNETLRERITSHHATIERANLSSGMYFCKVISNNIVIATGKFIIQ